MTDFTALDGKWAFDTAHSSFGFVARHAMVTKVRGKFDEFSGELTIDGANPNNSSVKASAKAASINTGNEQRDGHLRNSDFLETEAYPELTFVSTGVEVDDDEVTLTGDLTIKGVTKSVTTTLEWEGPATDPFGNQRLGFEGKFEINRSDFGVNFNAALETGGVLVSEKIVITLDVSAVRA